MKIAAYLRVSTDGQTLDSQRHEIVAWCERQGHAADNLTWYEDVGVSGKVLDRPQLAALRADCANARQRPDVVVLYRLDRLSRTIVGGLEVLTEWLNAGVRVVVVATDIDLSGAVGQMVAALLLGVAQMERETLVERTQAGIAAARARGKVWGGRKPGSFKVTGGPDRALELKAKGFTSGEIARAMGVSARTVRRWIADHSPKVGAA